MEKHEITVIARIFTDFPEKFGLPRQSGIVKGLKGKIVFEPPFRNPAAVKELSEYSHIWLLWLFSKAEKGNSSLTVRPPRLGGNKRVGVFATRSPYRPNSIGMSAVRLERVELDNELGPVIEVSGIDMMNGTPIIDIKPYLSFADSYPEAVCGFADRLYSEHLEVVIPESIKAALPKETLEQLYGVLSGDPRPAYHDDPDRIYGFDFGGYSVKFRVNKYILTVLSLDGNAFDNDM